MYILKALNSSYFSVGYLCVLKNFKNNNQFTLKAKLKIEAQFIFKCILTWFVFVHLIGRTTQ